VVEASFRQLASGGIDLNNQTGVGQSFGETILSQVPAAFKGFIEPLVPQFDSAFANSMSLAIAQTFWIGVVATVLGLLAALVMRELPLRETNGAPASVPAGGDM
jgi:ABC-type spermidine/putrescine transport system permease subunit II